MTGAWSRGAALVAGCWRAARPARTPSRPAARSSSSPPAGRPRSSTTRRGAAARSARLAGTSLLRPGDAPSGSPTTRARSSCSTSGARGAGPAAPRRRTCSSSRSRRRGRRPCSASTCATTAQAAADFVRDRGLTYDSIFDSPAGALAAPGGLPRNVVPLDDRAGPAAPGRGGVPDAGAAACPARCPLVQRLADRAAPRTPCAGPRHVCPAVCASHTR